MATMTSSEEICIGCGKAYTAWNHVYICPECENYIEHFNIFYLFYFLEQEDILARIRELERANEGYANRIRFNTNKHIRSCGEQHKKAKSDGKIHL